MVICLPKGQDLVFEVMETAKPQVLGDIILVADMK